MLHFIYTRSDPEICLGREQPFARILRNLDDTFTRLFFKYSKASRSAIFKFLKFTYERCCLNCFLFRVY